MEEAKKWYESKTLWLNTVAFVALVVQSFTGFLIGPEEQAGLLAILNMVLRIVTKKPLSA